MSNMNTIVLLAGDVINNTSIGGENYVGMTPVRGKPYAGWCLSSIEQNNFTDYTVVLRESNTKLKEYLSSAHFKNFNVKVAIHEDIFENDSILISLYKGLLTVDLDKPTQIVLGDTMIMGGFPQELDVVLAAGNVKSSKRWCFASTKDGVIDNFYDKVENLDISDKRALVGYYTFQTQKSYLTL